MVLTKLLPVEQGWFLRSLQPITVASFYRLETGETSTSRDDNYLTARFSEILKANPWLCARLVNQKVEKTNELYLSCPEEISNPLDYIVNIIDDELFKLNDWYSICKHLSPHFPKNTNECIGVDEILCKLVIFQNTPSTELALMFSLNHTIADGHTVYHIWKMLSKNETVLSMTVERVHDYADLLRRDTNVQTFTDTTIGENLGKLSGMMSRGLSRKIRGRPPPRLFMYKVNKETIQKRKAKYNSGDNFVSTNDILCSWLFSQCDVDGMELAVNMRGRIAELTEDLAGSYQILCPVTTSKTDGPQDFRRIWTNVVGKTIPAEKVPCPNMGVNWATLYHQVELDGYEHRCHIPVADVSKLIHRLLGIPLIPECVMLIFKLSNDEVGVMLILHTDALKEEYFDECDILDGKVSFNADESKIPL